MDQPLGILNLVREPINKSYGIFSVVGQRLTCYHVIIIIPHTVTMDVLLVLNALVSIINH